MHRRDIEMIDADAAPAEILEQAINSPHTRIPIFRGEPENIVGVIHAKDLSRAVHRFVREHAPGEGALEGFDIMDVAMPPYFVPGIDAARRADARVPPPPHPFRAGRRRVRRAAGARHARGHPRGDRRRHHRRARRRDPGRHRAAAGRLGRGGRRRSASATSTAPAAGSCPTRRRTPSPASSSTRRRRSRTRGRSSASTASASRCSPARATGCRGSGCAGWSELRFETGPRSCRTFTVTCRGWKAAGKWLEAACHFFTGA